MQFCPSCSNILLIEDGVNSSFMMDNRLNNFRIGYRDAIFLSNLSVFVSDQKKGKRTLGVIELKQ